MGRIERTDVPHKIVTEAWEYAQFHGMGITMREMKKLLDRIGPQIVTWATSPTPEFAKGYKGGVKPAKRQRAARNSRNDPRPPTGVKHVTPCCSDGKCDCRCHR